MPADPTRFPEPTFPYPRRFWWLTRLSALGCVLVAAALGVRWWWGDVAQRRLDAVIAAAKSRGEPILVTDYAARPPPPDETNAAFYLRRSGMALKYTPTEEWALENVEALPIPPDVAEVAAATVERYGAQLTDVREARRHGDKIDWAIAIRSPMWNVLLRDLTHLRDLGRLTRAAALLAAERGDHAAALEHVHGLRFMARAANAQSFVVSQRYATYAHRAALSTLTAVMVDAPLDDAKLREEIRLLIAELRNERPHLEALRNGIRGDRAMHLDAGQLLAAEYPVLRPALQLDALRLIAQDEAMIAAAGAPTLPAARAAFPPRQPLTGPKHHARFVGNLFTNAWEDENLVKRARLLAHTRLATTALAIRLYQHDHAGRRPPTLAVLVPDYLPAVPRDPFAAGDQPILYLTNAVRPYLYTLGEDGVDDTTTRWRPSPTDLSPLDAKDGFVDLAQQNVQRPVTTRPASPVKEE